MKNTAARLLSRPLPEKERLTAPLGRKKAKAPARVVITLNGYTAAAAGGIALILLLL